MNILPFICIVFMLAYTATGQNNKSRRSAAVTVQDSVAVPSSPQPKARQPLPEQDYIVRRPDGQVLDFREQWMMWSDSAQIRQLMRSGIKYEYDRLFDLLVRGAAKQEQTMVQNYSSILSQKLRDNGRVAPGETRRIAWTLASRGFTIERIEELLRTTGINIVQEYFEPTYATYLEVLSLPLIVTGHIDSMYIDNSWGDGYSNSFAVTVTETLKGDTAIKHLIIRDNSGRIRNTGWGKKEYYGISHAMLDLEEGEEYLLLLNKNNYEYEIEVARGRGEKINDGKPKTNCFAVTEYHSLQPINIITDKRKKWQETQRPKKIQSIRGWCEKFASVFRAIIQH